MKPSPENVVFAAVRTEPSLISNSEAPFLFIYFLVAFGVANTASARHCRCARVATGALSWVTTEPRVGMHLRRHVRQ
ncbi:hypothetical protein FB451DRAFT_1258564 [Mycena latifolia]|nr:hypothetical protein FB451DRAFT_1258564 [Mycena latifolia]